MDDAIKKLKPANGLSVGEELKKPNPVVDQKKLDQFIANSSQKKVEENVELPEGKTGVKVSVEIPISDPQKPNLSQQLKPMIPKPENDSQNVTPLLKPVPTEPPFDANAWLEQAGAVDGLIIDTRGFGFQPCIYPKIMGYAFSGSLEIIYYKEGASGSEAIKLGLAGWARDIEAARTEPRLTPGENYGGEPLVINPQDIEQIIENKIIIKQTAGAKIKGSDDKYKYLSNARVVLVVD